MRVEISAVVAGEDRDDFRADRFWYAEVCGHDPERVTGLRNADDCPQRQNGVAACERCERRCHDLDAVAHREQSFDVGLGEDEHGATYVEQCSGEKRHAADADWEPFSILTYADIGIYSSHGESGDN